MASARIGISFGRFATWRCFKAGAGRVLCLCLAACLGAWGCSRPNPAYCTGDQDCTDSVYPVCDLSIFTCVGPDNDQDAGFRDAVDAGVDGQDAQDGGFRDADGDGGGVTDVDPDKVVYVDSMACPGPGSGSFADPFCRLDDALASGADLILMAGGTYLLSGQLSLRADVEIQGQGDVTIESVICPGILVTGDVQVTLQNLTITGAGGIRVSGGASMNLFDVAVADTTCIGIDCLNSTCIIRRDRVSDNLQGGIRLVNAAFELTNTIVDGNGEEALFGGVFLQEIRSGSMFANNTVIDNSTVNGMQSGVTCIGSATISNSIIWANEDPQVSGNCTVNHCDLSRLVGVMGENNLSLDPLFVSEDDFHISSNSPCIDMADETVAPADDIDGQARPLGAGVDMGADEVR